MNQTQWWLHAIGDGESEAVATTHTAVNRSPCCVQPARQHQHRHDDDRAQRERERARRVRVAHEAGRHAEDGLVRDVRDAAHPVGIHSVTGPVGPGRARLHEESDADGAEGREQGGDRGPALAGDQEVDDEDAGHELDAGGDADEHAASAPAVTGQARRRAPTR